MQFTNRYRTLLIRIAQTVLFSAAIIVVMKLTLALGSLSNASTAAFGFLVIVLLAAFFGDLFVAVVTSIIATLCFDYFFLPPYGTFNIATFADWISLVAFLIVSLVISRLTASAAKHAAKVSALDQSMSLLKDFGEQLLSIPENSLTLTRIAQIALKVFSLEYCSVHVYGEGKWQHFTGAAQSALSHEVEIRLEQVQDHSMDLLELANENILGVHYWPINKGSSRMAVLAVKSRTLSPAALGPMAYLIGNRLHTMFSGNQPAQ